MKHDFNLEVSFNEYPMQSFEWTKTSMLLHPKIVKVSTNILKKVLLFEGQIDYKGHLVLSDGKNAVALKLADDGTIALRSFLKYEDELDVCEYALGLKETKLEVNFFEQKVHYERGLSIEVEMKKFLREKVETTSDEDLSKYLYYLYFNRVNDYSREKLLSSIDESPIDKNLKVYKFLIES